MHHAKLALTTLAALLTVAPAPAAHARPHRPESAFTHDGLLVRLAVGFGYGANTLSDDGLGEVALSGGAGFASIAIGGMIAGNLALNADLFGLTAFEPSVTVGEVDLGDLDDTRMTVGAVGIGLTYYVMPANVYLAASFGAAVGTLETRGRLGGATFVREARSEVGFAVNAMIGKEWWVGREWGLGVAGQLILGSLPDGDSTISVFGVGVLFSATYN